MMNEIAKISNNEPEQNVSLNYQEVRKAVITISNWCSHRMSQYDNPEYACVNCPFCSKYTGESCMLNDEETSSWKRLI